MIPLPSLDPKYFLFDQQQIIANLISSILFLLVIMSLRYLMIRYMATWRIKNIDDRRKWVVNVRNISLVVLLLGLIVIWATEIRTLALSIVAVATALVLAGKEIIACFAGGVLKASNKMFEVGDRIQILDMRGDVLDHSFTMTTLYEIGSKGNPHKYTGRVLKVPNSLFLSHPVVNETASSKYVLHTMEFVFDYKEDWHKAEKILLDIAHEETKDFVDGTRKYMSIIEKKDNIEAPDVRPQVFINASQKEQLHLFLRVPARSTLIGKVEQKIMRRFADAYYSSLKP